MNKFTKVLLGTASAVMMAGMVHAADAVVYEQTPEGYDWSGFYAGLHAGYGQADRDWNGTGVFNSPIDDEFFRYDMTGALVGAQVGYNWQVNNWVFGVEADAAWSGMDDFQSEQPAFVTYDVDFDVKWLATIRGRAGFAWDRFLFYGTGGIAFAGVDTEVTPQTFAGQVNSGSATHTGWVAGLGVEAMVTEKVSLKLEYLHADFGSEDYDYNLFPGPTENETNGRADLDLDTIRIGVNFHF